jgi:hypothetical protein
LSRLVFAVGKETTTLRGELCETLKGACGCRIQELSQTLEREQGEAFQLRREAEDLRMRCVEKDELLREQNEAMTRLTTRLEEENANR